MFNVSTCCGITLASVRLLRETPTSFPNCLATALARKNAWLAGGYWHGADFLSGGWEKCSPDGPPRHEVSRISTRADICVTFVIKLSTESTKLSRSIIIKVAESVLKLNGRQRFTHRLCTLVPWHKMPHLWIVEDSWVWPVWTREGNRPRPFEFDASGWWAFFLQQVVLFVVFLVCFLHRLF